MHLYNNDGDCRLVHEKLIFNLIPQINIQQQSINKYYPVQKLDSVWLQIIYSEQITYLMQTRDLNGMIRIKWP